MLYNSTHDYKCLNIDAEKVFADLIISFSLALNSWFSEVWFCLVLTLTKAKNH